MFAGFLCIGVVVEGDVVHSHILAVHEELSSERILRISSMSYLMMMNLLRQLSLTQGPTLKELHSILFVIMICCYNYFVRVGAGWGVNGTGGIEVAVAEPPFTSA